MPPKEEQNAIRFITMIAVCNHFVRDCKENFECVAHFDFLSFLGWLFSFVNI